MKNKGLALIILGLILSLSSRLYASGNKPSDFLEAYCGSKVLEQAFSNLGIHPDSQAKALGELNSLADKNRGFNSLYEIKLAAEKAGLNTKALKITLDRLSSLAKDTQIIANITGNRHFCLIRNIGKDKVSVYIPGLNYTELSMSYSQFLEYWDSVALLISKRNINLDHYKYYSGLVTDEQLKNIIGAQSCSNSQQTGGSVQNGSDSSSGRQDPSTSEPVNLKNGGLFLRITDITIPTRSLPLNLKRYYNNQVVSEVTGWTPELGAGSWSIENNEYSGHGNRSCTEQKFSDFTLELDMQTIQPGSHYTWETGWINFRYTEDSSDLRKAKDCYYFLIHTDGKIELDKCKN